MARSRRRILGEVWKGSNRKVVFGKLEPLPGHKPKVGNLFLCIGEKLPFECLPDVRRHAVHNAAETSE
jgi:hypothetical protein